MKPGRSVVHGTCLVDGHHPVGSKLAQECPALRREARHVQEKVVQAGIPARDAQNVPGSPPGGPQGAASRQRRYRGQHPEYQQREADRLKTRRTKA